MTSIPLPAPRIPARVYRAAQYLGALLTLLLLAGLTARPTLSLHVLWDMVIPLLPAVFLVNPLIWRNVCPLATLNSPRADGGAMTMDPRVMRRAWVVGIALLVVLVPARRVLFNVNGPVLAVTIVAVALLSVTTGLVYSRRAGFCNSLCPVLPVEKLYGQRPLVPMATVRCSDCSMCAASGCIDLAGQKAVAQTLGRSRRDARWLIAPFGAFAAFFPGFIVGYFTTKNGALDAAPAIYGYIAALSAASYIIVFAAVRTLRLPAAAAIPVLGAIAVTLYYWFAAPTLAAAYGGGENAATAVRVAAVLLVAAWLWPSRSVRQGR